MKTKTVYLIEVHFKVSIDGKYEEKPYYYCHHTRLYNDYCEDINDAKAYATEKNAKKALADLKSRDYGNLQIRIITHEKLIEE